MVKINYKSDFDFILTLRDAQGNDIGFPDFNWEARFWTFSSMCAVTASCHDGECENCYNDSGKIHVVINAPTLGCGKLRVELVTHRENSIYPDGERTVYTPDTLDIELVNGKGDAEGDVNAEIVFPATGTTKVLPRIEVRVCRDKNVHGKNPTNNGRAYLRLLNAQPYLDAGYKPILLRKCVRKQQYRKKGGDNRWDVHTKGWHIRGSQEALRLTPTQLGSFDDNIEHIVAITGDKFFNFGGNYSLNAIDFVKPHSPYYNDDERPYPNDIVVSWGTRLIRIYDDDGSEDGSASINAPIRFKFGIAFQKDSNFDKMQLNLPISKIVSNIATFSVLFNGSQISINKQDATNADCYRFGY